MPSVAHQIHDKARLSREDNKCSGRQLIVSSHFISPRNKRSSN